MQLKEYPISTANDSRPVQEAQPYRSDIDGLRAIAVLSVIINHLSSGLLPGGYLGVDIFFVISGYVITSSLERTRDLPLGSFLLHFYSRRIKRLMPALLAMVLVTSALIRLFDQDPAASFITAITSLFGLSNCFLFVQATNYFGASARLNPFSHTWSLGVEEQFYLLFPLLIRWRAPRSGNSIRADLFRVGGLCVLSGLSLALFVFTYRVNQDAAYFLMPFRFWELGAGCLLALLGNISERSGGRRPIRLNAVFPLLLMSAGLVSADQYPVTCTVVVVLSAALTIGSVRPGDLVCRALSSAPISYLGKISYSLYLWHWAIICLSR